jgi:hypothetical protein
MPGFNELMTEIEKKHPDDWWIKSRRETETLFPESFPQIHIYDNALRALDEDSWLIFSEKAFEAFPGTQGVRGKSQFFNLLNEALAYEYLVRQKFSNIRLLPATPKKKTPDISYYAKGTECYCEVKTISVSDNELRRLHTGEVFDCSIYSTLPPQFLEKLDSTIKTAIAQLDSFTSPGLVYIIANFDDISLDHYDTYKHQISEFLERNFPALEIIVRVGILATHNIIHHSLTPSDHQ